MHNEANMSCDDIKKKLKAFLDDLLAEDEYKVFGGHINICSKCREYVRSIGSLSNQLWKLGKVKVPQDFSSTILYKLAHPEEKTQQSKFVISKEHIIVGMILILLATLLFFGFNYFKKKMHSADADNAPILRTEIIQETGQVSNNEARSLIIQLKDIARKLGISGKAKGVKENQKEDVIVEEK